MKRYSASSKKAQQWIRQASKDNLFLCSIYDELGHYKQSESIYESTIKIARFIRVSEEELEEENPEAPEEDVDILYIEDVNTGRYDYGDVGRLYDNSVAGLEQDEVNELSASKQHVNEFIRALSMGGANVKTSLQHLSIALNRWTIADQRINEVKLALSYYYKNPIFTHPYTVFLSKMLLLWDNILTGNIDQDTVDIIADFNKEVIKYRTIYSSNYQKVQEFLKSYRPDVADNDLFIKFLVKRADYDIQDSEIESHIKKDIDFLDPLAIEKAYQLAQKASSRSINKSLNYNIDNLQNFIIFFSAYPQPKVFQKAMYLLEHDQMFYENAIEKNGQINLERAIFNTQIPFNKLETKFYPGFTELLLDMNGSLVSTYDGSRSYSLLKEQINPVLLVGGVENFKDYYGMPDRVLGENYFKDKPEERAFFENDPKIKNINNILWWVLGSKMNQADATNGLKAFYNLSNIIQSRDVETIIDCIIPSLLPIYIKYFSNDNFLNNVTLQSAISFNAFNKFYTLYGDKIYNYDFYKVTSFGRLIDDKTYEPKNTHMSLDKYEILEESSGEYLKNQEIFSFYFQKPYSYNIPYETLRNFTEFVANAKSLPFKDLDYGNSETQYRFALQNLYLVGKYDPLIYDTVGSLNFNIFNDRTKDYLLNLIYQYKNPDGATFIGNFEELKFKSSVARNFPELSPTELSYVDNEEDRNNVNKIREQMGKYKNYAHITPNSEEYNKLFPVFAKNFTVIGRDPKLIITLVDCAIEGQKETGSSPIPTDNKLYYISAALGINNLSAMDKWATNGLTSFSGFHREISNYSQSQNFCNKSGVKAAHIINLGGFSVLFEMSEEEVREWLEKIRSRDVEKFISEWKIYAGHPESLSTLHLKIDFAILHNKMIYLLYKSFFDRLRVENPNIFDDLGSGSDFAKVMYTQRWSNFFQEFRDYLESKVLNGVNNESELLRIYKLDVKLPRQLTLPKFVTETRKTNFDDKESIGNIGKIIQVLGNLSMEILDAYSFDACRKKGYPTKGFLAIPDSELKKTVIHDLANLLPNNLNQKFGGYAQYFKNNFKNDEKGELKFIGDSWGKKIAIWDDDNNVLEDGFVYEFASKYPINNLTEIIKRDSFRTVIKSLPVKDMTFAYQFCDVQGLPSEKDNESAAYKQLFTGTQEIFLQGLKVPLPDWSSFNGKSGDLTLRFLRRDEPQGMFLGLLSKCCQEPKNWAASCAYDGHLNPNAAFAVFEGPEGLIFQAYVWADKNGNVCFDSIESRKVFDFTKKYQFDAEELMKEFAQSLPSGKRCLVGNNPFSFASVKKEDLLINLTKTHELDFVSGMLRQFSPNGTKFYNSDSKVQYFVGVGK